MEAETVRAVLEDAARCREEVLADMESLHDAGVYSIPQFQLKWGGGGEGGGEGKDEDGGGGKRRKGGVGEYVITIQGAGSVGDFRRALERVLA